MRHKGYVTVNVYVVVCWVMSSFRLAGSYARFSGRLRQFYTVTMWAVQGFSWGGKKKLVLYHNTRCH